MESDTLLSMKILSGLQGGAGSGQTHPAHQSPGQTISTDLFLTFYPENISLRGTLGLTTIPNN